MSKLPRIGNEYSLTEQAYMAIKEAIINNDLQPHEVLTEEGLAAQLGISRTPIRAALEKLSHERLMVMKKGRNVVVAQFTKDDLEKVFAIRQALDPMIARTVAMTVNGGKLKCLEKILLDQKKSLQKKDFDQYLKKDYEFHVTLAKYTDNEILHDIIVNISSQVMRFLILSTSLQRNSGNALEEHQAILEALKKGDPVLAEKEAKGHVLNVVARFL
jgi:DNA-binding GntR family transcriptional regulator